MDRANVWESSLVNIVVTYIYSIPVHKTDIVVLICMWGMQHTHTTDMNSEPSKCGHVHAGKLLMSFSMTVQFLWTKSCSKSLTYIWSTMMVHIPTNSPGKAEVTDFDNSSSGNENILWLYITVDYLFIRTWWWADLTQAQHKWTHYYEM